MSIFDRGCDWYCDCCHAYLNKQRRFTAKSGTWTCTECGFVNDVTENNIIPDEGSNGYVYEKTYDDGTIEKIRFTKKREVHDFFNSDGTKDGSVWSRR